jgi:hypothetical protein
MCGWRMSNEGTLVAILFAVFAVFGPIGNAEEFVLEDVPVFRDPNSTRIDPQLEMMRYRVAQHRTVGCEMTPRPNVIYPRLYSPHPLYGSLPPANVGEKELHFVLDKSAPPAEETEDQSGAAEVRQLADLPAGSTRAPAGVKQEYDLLYVDRNADGDLTNDPPLRPLKEPPMLLATMTGNRSIVVFDYLEIPSSDESSSEVQSRRFVPWLTATVRPGFPGFAPFPSQLPGTPFAGGAPMTGVPRTQLVLTPATVRTGRVRLGDTWYQAILGSSMGGSTGQLMVRPEAVANASPSRPSGWQTIPLGRHQAADGFYEVALNSAGNRISVRPYRGPMGEFRLDPGDRQVERFGASGMLRTSTGGAAWIGEPGNYYSDERPRSCQLPVGDYGLVSLRVACGDLLVSLSPNSQRAPLPGAAANAAAAFPIAIREDQPFGLRLGDRPTLVFLGPPANANQVFRRGTTVSIRALLVDPTLNCMIRGLNDTTNKLQERTYPTPDGQSRTVPVYASLVPRVSITNSSGKVVANGLMPFG